MKARKFENTKMRILKIPNDKAQMSNEIPMSNIKNHRLCSIQINVVTY